MLYGPAFHIKSIVEVKFSLLTGIVFEHVGIVDGRRCVRGEGMGEWYANHILECLHDGFRFQNGPKPLSQLMRESMADDPVQPILWEPHLLALDRRVTSVLSAVADCIKAHSIHDVIFTNDLPWIFHKTWNYLQLNVKSIRLMIAALEFNCVSITLMRFWNWIFFRKYFMKIKTIYETRVRTEYLFIFSHLSHFHLAIAAISANSFIIFFVAPEFTFVHSL